MYMKKEGIASTPFTSPTLVHVLAKHLLVEMIGKESKKRREEKKDMGKEKQTD